MFVIDSATLLREIRLAQEFTGGLQYVKLAVKDGLAQISASDRQVSLTRRFPIESTEPFEALLSGEVLMDIARECPGELEIQMKRSCAVIKHQQPTQANVPAGVMQSEFKLLTQKHSFPPNDLLGPQTKLMTLQAADLLEALRWALPAMKDSGRFGMIFRQDEHLTLAATNGFVLATFGQISAQHARNASCPLIITQAIAERLLEALKQAEGEVEIRFDEAKGIVCFLGSGWHLRADKLEAEFPDMAFSLLKRETLSFATIKGTEFKKAFKQAAGILDHDGLVSIHFTPQGLRLRSKSGKEEVDLALSDSVCKGIAQEVRVRPRQLKGFLSMIDRHAWVGICAVDMTQPIVFLNTEYLHATWTMAGQKVEAKAVAA